MDHFSLPHDSLYLAQASGKLHRNFMGYTTTNTELLIGLGASAISDAKYAYAQNLKKVEDYSTALSEGKPAIFKGHVQTQEDLKLKKIILGIACQGEISARTLGEMRDPSIIEALEVMKSEGILRMLSGGLEVTESGRPFIRNICSIFDQTLKQKYSGTSPVLFSKSI
jgi:oxygen-independent coproporphyrinogen-3 oxidase